MNTASKHAVMRDSKPVDVIIACHNPARPVGRAVRSVVEGNGDVARAVVVCHNVERAQIEAVIEASLLPHVTFLELNDQIPSPTGPFMHGIHSSQAPWVSIMGSDDELQAGAVASLLQMSQGCDAVMIRTERHGVTVPTPPVRVFGPRIKNLLKDRLLYRSAPLGIMRREFLKKHSIELTPGLTNGGDLVFTQRLWSLGRIAVQRRGPGYVIHEDARDRVTMRLAAARDEFAHIDYTWGKYAPTDPKVRESLAYKYMRVHVFSWALVHAEHHQWTAEDREFIAQVVRSLLHEAPSMLRVLSQADVRLIRALLNPRTPVAELERYAKERRNFTRLSAWIPGSLFGIFHPESPLRFLPASYGVRLMAS